jgi:hypothetical protein
LNGTLIWWKKIELRHSLSCWLAGGEKRNHGEAQKTGSMGGKDWPFTQPRNFPVLLLLSLLGFFTK